MPETWPPRWGERTYVMGVINVTPDSFSGDGVGGGPQQALELALRLEEAGADILDVGGESTRPGATPVDVEEELRRVIPAVEMIARRSERPVSVDTTKEPVARQALEAGAHLINDVSGSRDPRLAQTVADHDGWLVLVSHGIPRDHPALMDGIVADLARQAQLAVTAGVQSAHLLIDPGLGMGKGWLENFEIIRELRALSSLDLPVLTGPSRKGMIARVLGVAPDDRLEGTAALVSLCIANGADAVRVHDVQAMVRVARMMDALTRHAPASAAY